MTRSSTKLLCNSCKDGNHTDPPAGATLCQCGVPTCACYVVPPRTAIRTPRGVKVTA